MPSSAATSNAEPSELAKFTLDCISLRDACGALPEDDRDNLITLVSELVSWGDSAFTLVDPEKVLKAIDADPSNFEDLDAVKARVQVLKDASLYIALEA